MTPQRLQEMLEDDAEHVLRWAYNLKKRELPRALDILLPALKDNGRPLPQRVTLAQALQNMPPHERLPGRKGLVSWAPQMIERAAAVLIETWRDSEDRELREASMLALRSISLNPDRGRTHAIRHADWIRDCLSLLLNRMKLASEDYDHARRACDSSTDPHARSECLRGAAQTYQAQLSAFIEEFEALRCAGAVPSGRRLVREMVRIEER